MDVSLSKSLDAELIRLVDMMLPPDGDHRHGSPECQWLLATIRAAFQVGVIYATRRMAECPSGREVDEIGRLTDELAPFVAATNGLLAAAAASLGDD